MNSRFLKNIIFLLFINLLVKPFWILGVDRTVQNLVGDANYGTYLAIFNFSYLFYIILDIGLTNFNSKNIASSFYSAGQIAGDATGGSLLMTLLKPDSKFSGSAAFIQAFSVLGKTQLVTSSTVTTLNNKVAPVQISTSRNYLKEITVTKGMMPTTYTVNIENTEQLVFWLACNGSSSPEYAIYDIVVEDMIRQANGLQG